MVSLKQTCVKRSANENVYFGGIIQLSKDNKYNNIRYGLISTKRFREHFVILPKREHVFVCNTNSV